MKKLEKLVSISIVFVLLLTTFPDMIVTASPSVNHEADDALLLMLASHNMISGGGLASAYPRTAVVKPQSIDNEVKILSDFYRQQIAEADRQGYGDHVKARLLLELETKLQILVTIQAWTKVTRKMGARGRRRPPRAPIFRGYSCQAE